MSHVTYVERDDAPEELRPTYDAIAKKLGAMLNFFKAMVHSPGLLPAFLGLNATQGKSALAPKLRELAFLRASAINGCDYCVHYHSMGAKAAGWSDSEIADVAKPEFGSAFDDLSRDVIKFADEVTKSCRADDALMARLKAKLSERELVELTATVALANYTNRVNMALAIDLP
jgi:uncharacterized peroxidase-related enzyme